jgi:hypothetical protein
MLYYLGVMQWIIKHFAWFFFKTMNISGAEAVVAASSPFAGQSEAACLVRPYVDIMTESELHLIMTSGEFFLFLNSMTIGDLINNYLRVLYHCWRCLERIHQLGGPRSKPYHGVCHEYSCFHRYQ